MPVDYKVVVSGSIMREVDFNILGDSDWQLVQIEQPDDGLMFYHIFTKSG